MSFTADIKREISYNELKECCCRAELSALLQLTSSLSFSSQGMQLVVKTENPTTAKRIKLLTERLYPVETSLSVYQKSNLRKNNIYRLNISEQVLPILEDLGIYGEKGLTPYPRYEIVRKECCARAYIAGAFIAYGSCNAPGNANYHLEIAMQDASSAAFVIRQLKRFGIEAKSTQRRSRHIVYIKKADSISDFLRCIGAQESLMDFENSRISRDFVNSRIRLDNCDIANMQKSMKTAAEQLKAIRKLEAHGRYHDLDRRLQDAAELRKAFPEESLSALCTEYDRLHHERISRSGLKHRFDKILSLAENLEDPAGEEG